MPLEDESIKPDVLLMVAEDLDLIGVVSALKAIEKDRRILSMGLQQVNSDELSETMYCECLSTFLGFVPYNVLLMVKELVTQKLFSTSDFVVFFPKDHGRDCSDVNVILCVQSRDIPNHRSFFEHGESFPCRYHMISKWDGMKVKHA